MPESRLISQTHPEAELPVSRDYASWIGQEVVLQLAAADVRVALHGVIVGESDDAIRFRIGGRWDSTSTNR